MTKYWTIKGFYKNDSEHWKRNEFRGYVINQNGDLSQEQEPLKYDSKEKAFTAAKGLSERWGHEKIYEVWEHWMDLDEVSMRRASLNDTASDLIGVID